jgi:pimeloyl-ACP methyl ester carboxylesterase
MEDNYISWTYAPGKRAKVRYQEYGNENSKYPPILFIHGYGAMLEHWDQNIPHFEDTHKIYAMDLLGFGGSEKPDAPYSIRLWSEQIKHFITQMDLKKVHLVGHSMGGATSMWFSHHHPHHLASLTLVDPSGIFADNVGDIERVLYKLIGTPIIGDVMFSFFANSFGAKQSLVPTYHNKEKVTEELIEQFAKPFKDKGAINSYLSPSRRPNDFLLQNIERPSQFKGHSLIIWGEHDVGLPAMKLIPEFQKLLPQASVHIIKDAAHCSQHDQPEDFNQALAKFLDSHAQLKASETETSKASL